jgi:hypothetical protein
MTLLHQISIYVKVKVLTTLLNILATFGECGQHWRFWTQDHKLATATLPACFCFNDFFQRGSQVFAYRPASDCDLPTYA